MQVYFVHHPCIILDMQFIQFIQEHSVLFAILATVWTLPWKGVSLWMAAQRRHKVWFIVLLILNSLAILDILYIFVFSKRKGQNGEK